MASAKESIEENICPICMYILIQPVTMPCSHELCLPCFKQNVEEANFCCPMCRMRISTWARKASRTKTLVNQERWQEIMRLFPDHVNRRLNGEDDEDLDFGVQVNIRLAKPGEIRTEYEEQLRKLRQEYAEQRRKEQEASEQLIRRLQEQEKKKLDLEKQDEELAKELSEIMNKANVFSPYGTRSGSGTSDSGSIKSFIEAMKSNNQASGSPYPYQCLTPVGNGKICVDKDRALLLEKKFKQNVQNEKHLLTTQDLLNLEKQYKLAGKKNSSTASATVVGENIDSDSRTNSTHSVSSVGQNSSLSQDEILQQMSEQLELGINVIDSPDCVIVEPKTSPGSAEKKSLKLNQKNLRSVSPQSNSDIKEIVELDTPTMSGDHSDKKCTQTKRSASSQSNDSISPELAHFRPIRACPLTPPRQLSGGRVVEPVLIRTTPRNLSKSLSSEERSLSDIDASSPIMQKCLEQLEEERKDKVVKMSKSTTTRHGLQDSENKDPDPACGENSRKHIINSFNNLNLSRSAEFKDISNSPLPKRKYDTSEGEEEITPKRKKLIIPLEPDLNDDVDVFEINDFDMALETVSPRFRDKDSNNVSRSRSQSDSRSKSKIKQKKTKNASVSTEKSKVRNNVQSAITNWIKKQEELSPVNSGDSVTSKHQSQDIHKSHSCTKPELKKDKNTSIVRYFEKNVEKKRKLRSRDKIRKPRHPEYDYPEISPRKRKTEIDMKSNGAVSKLSFNSDDSDGEDSDVISENGKDSGKESTRSPCKFDGNNRKSTPDFNSKKRRVYSKTKHRYRSGSDNKTVSKHKTSKTNKHSNHTRTVEDFFKGVGKHGKRIHSDPTLGELDGIIDGNTGISQEEQDRLLAQELQKQFDFEHKYHLNSVRLKGSEESYSLRQKRHLSSNI